MLLDVRCFKRSTICESLHCKCYHWKEHYPT